MSEQFTVRYLTSVKVACQVHTCPLSKSPRGMEDCAGTACSEIPSANMKAEDNLPHGEVRAI